MVTQYVQRLYKQFRHTTGRVGRDAAVSLRMAKALASARASSCEWNWDNDPDGWPENGVCSCGCGAKIETCESCVMFDDEGTCVASLHGIWDASDGYRRHVEAELAIEAGY